MYKFVKTLDSENKFDISNTEITIPHNEVGLSELLEEFECFLLACGFKFDGSVQIVADDE